jgi:hypothetical protein
MADHESGAVLNALGMESTSVGRRKLFHGY